MGTNILAWIGLINAFMWGGTMNLPELLDKIFDCGYADYLEKILGVPFIQEEDEVTYRTLNRLTDDEMREIIRKHDNNEIELTRTGFLYKGMNWSTNYFRMVYRENSV